MQPTIIGVQGILGCCICKGGTQTCGNAQGEAAAQGIVVRLEGPSLGASCCTLQNRSLHLGHRTESIESPTHLTLLDSPANLERHATRIA